jgi:hypothetical protein
MTGDHERAWVDDPGAARAGLGRPDRALVTFRDLGDVEAKRAALKDLLRRWMIATSDGG